MKKLFIIILSFLTIGASAQKSIVKKIEIYGVSWKLRTHTPTTIKNLKKRSQYRLVLKEDDFGDLFFDDYKSCKELLMSQDTISFLRYHPYYRGKTCIACVKLFFRTSKVVTIYFRANGEYYFQGKYYKANKELYYCIFSFFTKDAIMPDDLIQEGKVIYDENRRREQEKRNRERQEFLERQITP